MTVQSPLLFCVSLAVFSPSLRVPPAVPLPDLGAAWTSSGGPGVHYQHPSKRFLCFIPICCKMKYVFCILHPVCLYLFSLSPSLYSLRPLSLSLLLFRSRPTLGRTVPPREPGPAQGFFLFKVAFFLATVLTRGFRLRVSASVKHLETVGLEKAPYKGKKLKIN